MRLHKYLSRCGVGSLRKCEEYIKKGFVSVNGKKVDVLGYTIDPEKDIVKFKGKVVKEQEFVYVVMNKPRGYVTTVTDPYKRPTVIDLIKKAVRQRIYPVGRLDINTTGLLILTNDGYLTNYVINARNKVPKVYIAKIHGKLKPKDINLLKKGIRLSDGKAKVEDIKIIKETGNKTWVQVTMVLGRNRIVRRLFEKIGHPVDKLHRERIGKLDVKGLPKGGFKFVTKNYIYKRLGLEE